MRVKIAFGRALKLARRSRLRDDGRGVTLMDIQVALGTSSSVWAALENYGHLPARFATLRSYIGFLGLDEEKLLTEYESVRQHYAGQLERVPIAS